MDNQQESLVTIPSFDNYSATKDGRIYSHKRNIYLKPKLNKDGYHIVSLMKNGKLYTKSIHRLIALTFLDNPYSYKCVHHKDDCKTNNELDNLEWCTHSYNNKKDYKLKAETRKTRNQYSGTRNKYKEQVLNLKAQGLSNVKISKIVGISNVTVGKIVQESSQTI